MSKTKHTPGPFRVFEGGRTKYVIEAQTSRGLWKPIAAVGGYGGAAREYNAKLFAAAPDLLLALFDCVSDLEPYADEQGECEPGTIGYTVQKARIAIRKATEGTP